MNKLSVVSALALSAALLLPAFSASADTDSTPIEKLISEMADKPEQHQAISKYYEGKVEATKKDLAQHQEMRKAYFGSGKNQQATDAMRKHCDNLIKLDESLVKEYEAMVAEHKNIGTKKP